MGIGGGIFLIAFGAILTFAVHAQLSWLDLAVVGWVLMLSGLTVLILTIWFWQQRRRRVGLTLVEQTQLNHDLGGVHPVRPDRPDADMPPSTAP
jgi:membrane protein implicated in regulation of membrane protease activity